MQTLNLATLLLAILVLESLAFLLTGRAFIKLAASALPENWRRSPGMDAADGILRSVATQAPDSTAVGELVFLRSLLKHLSMILDSSARQVQESISQRQRLLDLIEAKLRMAPPTSDGEWHEWLADPNRLKQYVSWKQKFGSASLGPDHSRRKRSNGWPQCKPWCRRMLRKPWIRATASLAAVGSEIGQRQWRTQLDNNSSWEVVKKAAKVLNDHDFGASMKNLFKILQQELLEGYSCGTQSLGAGLVVDFSRV